MFRLCKPRNFVLPSPINKEVWQQPLPVCIPIILEPIRGLHKGPVAVLDYQSLFG
jgi:DNA polymerase zeta